jgi:hypothetical protein
VRTRTMTEGSGDGSKVHSALTWSLQHKND